VSARLASVLATLALAAPAAAGSQAPPARSVRELAADRTPRPVKLAGVVTHVNAHRDEFWVQDETGGVAVRQTPTGGLRPGDRVEVDGTSGPAAFSPDVRKATVTALPGRGALPEPVPFDLSPAAARALDGRWVRAAVLVRGASTGGGFTRVEVDSAHGAGTLLIPGEEHAARAGRLRGAVLEVRGVCEPDARGGKLAGRPRVYLARLPDPPPPAPPVGLETVAALADRLLRHDPDPVSGLRARVAGVVTAALPGFLVVQDGTGGVTVRVRSPGADVPVGTRVEADGLLRADDGRPSLVGATVTPLGPAAYPDPVAAPAAGLAARAGVVVRTAGTVEGVREEDGWSAVSLTDGPTRFEVYAPGRPGENALAGLEPGTRVEVVGVPVGPGGPGANFDGFYLPNPGAVVVTARPADPGRWTAGRAAAAAGGALALAAAGWVWVLRGRVRRAEREGRRRDEEKAGLEEQLRRSQKLEAVGQLAAGVAHDFNNQLTVIIGCADLAAAAAPAGRGGRVAELVDNIRRAADRAADLTARLLTLSRRREVAASAVDLNGVVADTVRLLDRVLGEHIRIEAVLAPGLPPVRGEPGLLHQALMNLAVNARDAMPGGGTLTVTTALVGGPEGSPGRYVRLTVSDTGEGMPEAVRARAFEPFFTTKEAGKGTGLGLATVHGAVRALRGRIRVESAVGRGTTFEIDLRPDGEPVTDSGVGPSVPTPPPAARLAAAPRLAGVAVLAVEDDDGVRELLAGSLAGAGAVVLAAPTPADALGLLSAGPPGPDVMVADVVLPGMGGRELAARVRAAHPGVRVVFASGHPAEEVLRGGDPGEVVEFLPKPFTPDQLVARILRVLGRE
jgi:signal transduction histidine kinase